MNIEELREYCLSLPLVAEYMPFKNKYLIFKVYDKWFAVIPLDNIELSISVKCEPEYGFELREKYKSITSAWHFNKKYWNTIAINYDVDDDMVKHLIRHSIDQVVLKLPKQKREEYTDLKDW